MCLCFLFKFTRTAALQGNRQKMPVFCGDKVAKRPIGFLLFIADFSSSCSQWNEPETRREMCLTGIPFIWAFPKMSPLHSTVGSGQRVQLPVDAFSQRFSTYTGIFFYIFILIFIKNWRYITEFRNHQRFSQSFSLSNHTAYSRTQVLCDSPLKNPHQPLTSPLFIWTMAGVDISLLLISTFSF